MRSNHCLFDASLFFRFGFIIICLLFFSIKSFPFQRDGKIKVLQSQAEEIGGGNLDSVLLLLNMAELLASSNELGVVQSESEWIKAKTYYSLRNYGESKQFAQSAIEKASKFSNNEVLAKSHNLMGLLLKREDKLEQALIAYRQSLKYKQLLSDSLGVAKTLQNVGIVFKDMGVSDSAFIYYQRSIDIKLLLKDTVSLGKTIANLGGYFLDVGKYEKAIDLYRQASEIYQENNYEQGLANTANGIGACYYFLGFHQLSLSYYLKALSTYKSLGLREQEGNALFNIAGLYKRLMEFEIAMQYYLETLKIYEETGSDNYKANIYMGIGDVYLLEDLPDEALKYFKLAEEIYSNNNKVKDMALVRHGQGKAYARLKDYNKAKAYYQESILNQGESNEKMELGNVYNSLAVTNFEVKEYSEALKNYQAGLLIGQELKLPSLVRGSLLGLSEVYQVLGNNNKALTFRIQYETVKDSLDNVEKSGQIAELREIYESEKKDKQITQLELENEVVNAKSEANAALADKQRAEKVIYILTALGLLVFGVILYFYFRQRLTLTKLKVKEEKEGHIKAVNEIMVQQQTKTLEAMVEGQEKERKRIAKELHDHFGSLMAAVKVNLTAVAEDHFITSDNNQQMKNLSFLVDKACEDIRTLSHSMNIGISENFGLLPALKDLAYSISQSERIQVQFHASNFSQELDLATEVTAYRLVQELVSNALKHAKASKITIQLTCLDNILNLIVEDNGVGFDANHFMENSSGIGLKSIQSRIADMQGDFQVDSRIGKGTTVIIDLPVNSDLALEMS
ncbi:MAG: two-component system NarL family sensor kinase [Roseivirga sp.]|jgi:two-component system NarL family sensor kinase